MIATRARHALRVTAVIAAVGIIVPTASGQVPDPVPHEERIAATIAEAREEAVVVPTEGANGTLVTDGALVEVSVPGDSSEPVVLVPSPDLGERAHEFADLQVEALAPAVAVSLPELRGARAAKVAEDGTVTYSSRENATLAVQSLTDGVRFLTVLDGKGAPTAYEYTFEVGDDLALSPRPDGGIDFIDNDSVAVARIDAPWAYDARGMAVPTHYEVSGTTVIQHVDHLSSDFAYPITADPKYSWGWGFYVHFNRAETKTIATMGWGVAVLSTACGAAGSALAPGVGTAVGIAMCAAVAGTIVYRAGTAQNSKPKRCLYLQFTAPGSPPASGTYKDNRCK